MQKLKKNLANEATRIRRKDAKILGIAFNSTSRKGVLRDVRDSLEKGRKFFIVTPNPEIVIRAQKDNEFYRIINLADISLPDGIGLAAAWKFLSLPNPKNPFKRVVVLLAQGLGVGFSVIFDRNWLLSDFKIIKGREMFMEMVRLANKKGWRVFLLGGKEGVAKETAKVLERSLKKVKIKSFAGPMLDKDAHPISGKDKKLEQKGISEINKFKPHLLFVAFKFPKQEKWVYKWLPKLDVGGAMVVGGTFSYISGRSRLPPRWFSEAGLEWLWRLVNEPWRLKRILRAVFVFSSQVFLYKLNRKDDLD